MLYIEKLFEPHLIVHLENKRMSTIFPLTVIIILMLSSRAIFYRHKYPTKSPDFVRVLLLAEWFAI